MLGFSIRGGNRRWVAALLLGGSVLGSVAYAPAADDTQLRPIRRPTDTQDLTTAVIRSRADEAARSTELDAQTKARIADLYQNAHAELLNSEEELRSARTFQTRTDQQRLSRIATEKRAEIERLKTTEPWLPTYRDQAQLQEAIGEKDDELKKLKFAVNESERDIKQRVTRRNEILKALPTARAQLDDATEQLDFSNTPAEHPLLMLAHKTELRARKRFLEYHVARLELEQETYDQEDAYDVPRLNRYVLYRRLELAEAEKAKLDERHQKYVSDQSRLSLLKANEEFARTHPLLKPYAEKNVQLAKETQELSEQVTELEANVKKMKVLREETEEKFAYVKQKEKAIGQTGPIGLLLRKTKADLPDLAQLQRNVATRREQIDDLNFKILGIEDDLKKFVDISAIVARIVAEAPVLATSDEWSTTRNDPIAELRRGAKFAIERQHQYLKALKNKYNQQYQLLWELDAHEREVVNTTSKFASYIDERVLWIRSGRLLGPWDLEHASKQELAMFVPANWAGVFKALHADFRRSPEITLVALLVFFSMLRMNRIVSRHLAEISSEAAKPTCTDLWLTAQVLGLSVVRSFVFPVVPAFFGWRLLQATSASTFPITVAQGLLTIAIVGWPMRLVSLLCKHDGLAEAHLQWSHHACDLVRRHMRWLMGAGLTLVFVGVILDRTSHDADYSAIERMLFIGGMLVTAGFFRRLFKPETGVLKDDEQTDNDAEPSWNLRVRQAWYYAAQAVPVTLAVMSVLGYDYTARQLSWKLMTTSWLAFGLVIIAGVMMRQVTIRHRKLTYQLTGAFPVTGTFGNDDTARLYYSSSTESNFAPRVAAEATSLNRMLHQTTKLIRTMAVVGFMAGCWMVWSDVIPALKIFDQWPLWMVETTQIDDAGKSIIVNEPVTIPNVVMAIILATCTWVAVRNLSGLLNFTLLEKLPIDKASRYAVNALASYAVMVLGTMAVFGTLGVSWSKVQWLVTALTFGLAFGLQEVFANFVSGIIILFERPLRIGDVVTIGDVSGTVSQIRMRATTITNGDRQEFIVPNKEFITGRLLNWTLSDEVNRIILNVGVAYGSDVDKVRNLILQVASRHIHLLRDPEPTVTFESFGDSSLLFTLRAFLPTMEHRRQTSSDLHTQIYKALNEHGIEMAFPQQDIHIKTLPPELTRAFSATTPQQGKQEPPKPGTPISRVA